MPASALFLLLCIVCLLTQNAVALCPPQCECKWKSGKESVICLNANLSVVPLHLDAGTQVLDLTGNGLVTLRHEEFSKAGLVNLQKVHLAKCRLKNIERYSFKHLINLVELDLSNNLLSNIPSHTFDSITELRELRLNGNPITKIYNDAFLHLTQLTRLELSDCRVSLLEPRAFAGLERSLEWLKLDNNKLMEAEATSFLNFQSLHGLELANNPWNCTCSILPLRVWMVRQNVPFGVPPLCHSPKRLHMKPWDRLSLDEYACMPSIDTIKSVVYGTETNNVTLQCRTSGVPEPEVRWSFKNKVLANLSTPYAGSSKLYVMVISNHTSELRIYNVDTHDAGSYLCTAENKAGRAEASVQLHVSKKPPDGILTNKMLIASVMTGVALVLVLCLIFLCLFSVRKKQVFKWRNRECAREDNYEKIEMNHKSVKANGGVSLNQDKNGEYRVIPGIETDQDAEEEEESNVDSVSSKKWNGSKSLEKAALDHIVDQEDLHIPRRTIQVTRDNTTKASISTYGTYNHAPQSSQLHPLQLHYSPTSSTASSGTASPYHHPASSFRRYIPTTSYTPTKELTRVAEHLEIQQRTLPRTLKEHQDLGRYRQNQKDHQDIPRVHQDPIMYQQDPTRNYPDLIERSPNSAHFRTYKGHGGGSRAASETSGSVQDINEIFCTLPRKKDLVRGSGYHSSDSQTPLLPDSRYASSSGGESFLGSQDNGHRRMSDSQRYVIATTSLNRSRLNKVSGSFLNLAREEYVSGKEIPAEMNATPLLDVSALESRLMAGKRDFPPLQSTSDGSTSKTAYDYHAAQLERFLEEYRALQKELTKMKETCQDTASGEEQQEVIVSPSSLEESEDFKNFENELTKYLISEKLSPSITSDLLKS